MSDDNTNALGNEKHDFSLKGQTAIITGVLRDGLKRTSLVQLNNEVVELERLKLYMRHGLNVFVQIPEKSTLTRVLLRTDGVVQTEGNGIPLDNLDNLGPIQI